MIITSLMSLFGLKLVMPRLVLSITLILLGLYIGNYIDKNLFSQMHQWIWTSLIMLGYIILSVLLVSKYLEKFSGYEKKTSIFSAAPGALGPLMILAEDQKTDLMRDIAGKNESRFIHSNENTITKEELEKFTYMEHPSNVAVALDACKEAGVERKTALAGMHKVKPDLGALIAWNLNLNGKNIQFIY